MKHAASALVFCGLLLANAPILAQQAESFGRFAVHYNVLNSDQIPAQVAQGYGIRRSSSRALLNITVLDTSQGESGTPLRAAVSASSLNLTGQRRDLDMREIAEPGGAIYYIGELPVHHLETYNFTVMVQVEGEPEPFELRFRHQFYTE